MANDNNHNRFIEDLLGLTDSESSTSSSNTELFDIQQPLILELHELKKDDPNAPPTETQAAEAKSKKHKKKKKPREQKSRNSISSECLSMSSVPPAIDTTEDEFYDAQESYHALSDNQLPKPVTAVAMAQEHSEHGQNPKVSSDQTTAPTNLTAKEPLTITKPVTRPE